jgi:hypothetical protein
MLVLESIARCDPNIACARGRLCWGRSDGRAWVARQDRIAVADPDRDWCESADQPLLTDFSPFCEAK